MAVCKKIRRVDKRICIGAMNRKIALNKRTLTVPSGADVDFNEVFSDPITVWANVRTVSGVIVFDSTNTAREVSHEVDIRYRADLTAETWIKLLAINSTVDVYLYVIQLENLNEENKYMRLRCTLRGDIAKPVNFS